MNRIIMNINRYQVSKGVNFLADYKRMVSYMYQYENGVKKKNVGFARIELRSGQIKLTLHMQLLGQLDSIFPTYLIQRDKDGMELIYLGDSMLKSQVMDSKLNANENNVMDSGYNFSAFSGILLFLSEDIFYATQWDDKPIIVSEVMEALKPNKKNSVDKKVLTDIKEDRQKAAEAEKKEDGQQAAEAEKKEDGQEAAEVEKKENFLEETLFQKKQEEEVLMSDENLIPKYKLPGGYKFIEAFQNKQAGQPFKMKAEESPLMETDMESENLKEEAFIPNDIKFEEAAVSLDIAEKSEIRENIDYEADVQEKLIKDAARQQEILQEQFLNEKMFQEELIHNAERNEEEEGKVRETQTESRQEDEGQENPGAARIFNHYPRIYPFEDNEITMCVKIEPKDIGYLPMGAWGLSNNSFLLHGFYCYHHLIFAKMVDQYGCRYIIGVPGIYHSREQFMARMFGFESFKSIRKRELRQGDFGYWYLAISM